MFMSVVKKNLKSIVAATMGLLHFAWLALPFFSVRIIARLSANGYRSITGANAFATIWMILALVGAISLLLLGGYLVLRGFLNNEKMPVALGSFSFTKLLNFIHLGYAGSCFLAFIGCCIFSLSYGASLGIGSVVMMLLSSGSVVALFILEKKGVLASEQAAPAAPSVKVVYSCSQCGAPSKAGVAFCSQCGGRIVATLPVKYVCSGCGAASDGTVAFCSQCGGRIVMQESPAHFCSSCGTAASETAAFCPYCGGPVIHN